METSGIRESFTKTVDGPLTPIAPTSVGELTPVSVETQKPLEDFDSTSDEVLEVPTDISAVLTVVENKNKEEVEKLREKIDSLSRENGSLKEQLKKYVSALQMLNNADEDLEGVLDNLGIEQQQPDYKYEAKVFEKKLVQVRSTVVLIYLFIYLNQVQAKGFILMYPKEIKYKI